MALTDSDSDSDYNRCQLESEIELDLVWCEQLYRDPLNPVRINV